MSAGLAILLFFASIRLIISLKPRKGDDASLWAMWFSVLLVAVLAVLTLIASAASILFSKPAALLLLQSFFTLSTSGCALFGLLMLFNTFRSLRKELKQRKQLEAINAEHQSGMEKMILERTSSLRKEVMERQKLTRQLLDHNKRMESDLRLAGTLQRALMPESIRFPYLKGAIQYHPYGHVSGDFYDRIANERGDVYIFCGDAMGHGTPAALFTFMLSAAIRSSNRQATPSEILSSINQMLLSRNLELYATGVLACFSPEGRLTICHAGHESALLLRANGEFADSFKHSGFALGMFNDADFSYKDESVQLAPGDRVIFYTDGLTEAVGPDGNAFGIENLKAALNQHRQEPLEQTSAEVIEAVYDHTEPLPMRDDLTLLITEYGDSDE